MRDQKLEALKTAIVSDRGKRRGPFSTELRQRLMAHVEQARASGQSVEKISRELGLCSKTVHLWLAKKKQGHNGLRRVQVISERALAVPSALSMRGPAGTCVDGLDVDDVVAIWRKLGC